MWCSLINSQGTAEALAEVCALLGAILVSVRVCGNIIWKPLMETPAFTQ